LVNRLVWSGNIGDMIFDYKRLLSIKKMIKLICYLCHEFETAFIRLVSKKECDFAV